MCGQGHVVLVVQQGLLICSQQKPPTFLRLILQAVAVKPLSNHGGRLKAHPLDTRYGTVPFSKQALADLLGQN